MEKGIERIKWTGEGQVASNLSIPNVKVTIKADQFVYFQVSEWADGTTKAEKEKNIFWDFQTNKPRKSILETTRLANQKYGIKLPKKLCGPYTYYLEASIVGLKYSQKAGLAVGGWCESKIIKSKWSTTNDGEDVRNSHVFSYGNTIHLNLDTEGLNGHKNLIVDIYRDNGKEGELIKVYTSVDVNDGEINLAISDTFTWFGKIKGIKDVEQFYVKIKNPGTKKYISNRNNETIHARFLKIKKKVASTVSKPPTNLTPLKVGELDKYLKNAGHCRFKEISIYENEDPVILFNEGKFIRKLNPNDKSIVTENIYYDYDKWDIREDAKPILEKIATFLLEPPRLPVELGSHTDTRGTDAYNMELSEKRAQSVVDYLIKKGVDPINISAKGYGKSKLINHGDHISEALHQQNRRTTLKFKIFENDAQALVHNAIVPSYKLPKKIKIQINGFTRKGCVKKADHKNEITIIDSYLEKKVNSLKDGDNSVSHSIHSITPSIPQLLEAFLHERGQIFYRFYLHSCAYYSIAKTEHPTFVIKAYPDVNWVVHYRYAYPEAPFFKNIPVDLVTGIRFLTQIKEGLQDYIKKIGFLSGAMEESVNSALESFTAIPNDIQVGFHALHDFSSNTAPTQRIDYSQEYKAMAEVYVALLSVVVILVELLILYLTKGKGSFGRLRRYRKAARISKKMKEMGFELMTPKLSYSKAYYFEIQKDGRIANVSKERIVAYPFIGVSYHKIHKLSELAGNSAVSKEFTKLVDNYGANSSLQLDFEGTINADYTAVFSNLTGGNYTIYDKASNVLTNSEGIYTSDRAIVLSAELIVNGVAEKTITWMPFTPPQHIKVTVDLKAKLGGYISFTRKHGIENRKAYTEDTLTFSGLKGTYMLKIKATNNEKEVYGHNPESKVVPFTIFEEQFITSGRVTAFNF